MASFEYTVHSLIFKRPAGTSRGILYRKPCWYIVQTGEDGIFGLGEVSYIPGLSPEDQDQMEKHIQQVCRQITGGEISPDDISPSLPGIRFALETIWQDRKQGGSRILFPSSFTRGQEGISTNGLIWMGDAAYMKEQIRTKLDAGFRVLKLKVGALKAETEREILRHVRNEFRESELEIRLDANGAWSAEEAPRMLHQFAEFGIHSIEQPISRGQEEAMSQLCAMQVIPVALDEELIGFQPAGGKRSLLEQINPDYLVLKPGLLGGFSLTEEWIRLADSLNIGWWITSSLESSVGLNAIAQWTFHLGVTVPQGLGVGTLYTNNIPSPLRMEGDKLFYKPERSWDLQKIPGLKF